MGMQPHFLVPVGTDVDQSAALSTALEMAAEVGGLVSLLLVREARRPELHGVDAVGYLHAALRSSHPDAPVPRFLEKDDSVFDETIHKLLRSAPLGLRRRCGLRLMEREGDAVAETLGVIRDEQITTLVLAARPRRWWQWWPSISDRILTKAPCRVIIIRPESGSNALSHDHWTVTTQIGEA